MAQTKTAPPQTRLDGELARRLLTQMALIRRFEEKAAEMYALGKIGGFLHLYIGQEAVAVGATSACRPDDYAVSSYREHGHCLAKGSDPRRIMAELFGRMGGLSHGKGGSMHLFDKSVNFLGGHGIVGAHLPLAAGAGFAIKYQGGDQVVLCYFGDGAVPEGEFHESMNLAALWKLPVVFMVINNQFGMGTSLSRHSAVTDLQRKGESLGVPGMRCDGMDVLDTHAVVSEALRRVREERRPLLVEAVTYRFRGHSMADPEDYRSKEEVAEWRERDPIPAFGDLLQSEGMLSAEQREQIDRDAIARMDEAVDFAERSPFPEPHQLYEDVYVLDEHVHGHYHSDSDRNAWIEERPR